MKKSLQLLLCSLLHPVQLCRWEWYVSLGQVPKIAGIRLRSADTDAASLWTRAFIMHPLPFYESHSTTQRQGPQPNAIPTDRALLQGYSNTVYPYCPRSSASH
ncbi:hypothetical protein Q8A67_018019 [Cirrhinus molitorella]|uniref:Secreted protein n=1 Tax=Cirrhinus molitorella TaxID=172907 RepID=A0AA88TEA8_9TELE|nr:hypothetical protein Q8A67_018019 [Cirrhinus molitorella]